MELLCRKWVLFMVLVIIFGVFPKARGESASEELAWETPTNADDFQKFTAAALPMIPDDVNPILKTNISLAKYFRMGEKNVETAKSLLADNLKFRKEYKIDAYNKSEFGFMPLEFPFQLNLNYDKKGRPIVFMQGGRWRYYKAINEGKQDLLVRHIYHMWEDAATAALNRSTNGVDVARYIFLVDAANMDVMNINANVVTLFTEVNPNHDKRWPRMLQFYIYINVQSIFDTLLQTIKPSLHKETQNKFYTFGTDPKIWKPFLLQLIEEKQLPTKITNLNEPPPPPPPAPGATPTGDQTLQPVNTILQLPAGFGG